MVAAYSPEIQAEAIAIGMAKGAIAASKATGVPRRTISRWLRGEHVSGAPVVTQIIAATEEAIAARLWDALTLGLEQLRAGLLDPKARLSDKARATEVIANQWALLSGRATARTENLNLNADANLLTGNMSDEERDQARELLRALAMADLDPDETRMLRSGLDARVDRDALDRVLADPLHIDPADAMHAINAIEARLAELGE